MISFVRTLSLSHEAAYQMIRAFIQLQALGPIREDSELMPTFPAKYRISLKVVFGDSTQSLNYSIDT